VRPRAGELPIPVSSARRRVCQFDGEGAGVSSPQDVACIILREVYIVYTIHPCGGVPHGERAHARCRAPPSGPERPSLRARSGTTTPAGWCVNVLHSFAHDAVVVGGTSLCELYGGHIGCILQGRVLFICHPPCETHMRMCISYLTGRGSSPRTRRASQRSWSGSRDCWLHVG
jgi:hypothetical protein